MTSRSQQAERVERYHVSVGKAVGSLLFLSAIGGVLWIWFGMVKLDRWPIQWLEVDGGFERVSAEQVRTRVAPLVDGSFFTVNPEAIRAAARELAWVDQVQVIKSWPDTVRVVVSEYTPVAHWTEGRLIASDGTVFEVPGAERMQGLPWLDGPPGSLETVLEHWQIFAEALQRAGERIERMQLDRRGAWSLQLRSGTRVEIGRNEAIDRLQRMATSWPALRRQRADVPMAVDLRYSNGFAVRWSDTPPELAANR